MRFVLPDEDMEAIARIHGMRCQCKVCEAYAHKMRKQHSEEQDRLIERLAEKHGLSIGYARDWLYRGKIGRRVRKNRYRRRRYVLTEEDVENSPPPRPVGRPKTHTSADLPDKSESTDTSAEIDDVDSITSTISGSQTPSQPQSD